MSESAGKRDTVPPQPYTEEVRQSPSPKKRKFWDEEEEEALAAGVEKYGEGRWRQILDDEEYGPILRHRGNVQLKDKWRNIVEKSGGGAKKAEKKSQAIAKTSATDTAATAASAADGDHDDAEFSIEIPDDPRPLEILRSRLPIILGNMHAINAEFRECANVLPLQRTLHKSCALEETLKNACEMAGIDITDISGRAERKTRKKKRRRGPPAESPGGIHFQLRPFRTKEATANNSELESESDDDEDKKVAGEDTSEKKKKPAAPRQAKGDGRSEVDEFSPLQTRAQRRAGAGAAEQQGGTNDESFFSKTLRTLGLR